MSSPIEQFKQQSECIRIQQHKPELEKRKRKKSTSKQSKKNIDLEGMMEVTELSEPPPTEPSLYQNDENITPAATAAPVASGLRSQLRTDLWKTDSDGLAYFFHQAKGKPTNLIEHYISSPGDITTLPWNEALQIIDKFGLLTAKIHLIFAAHTMRQEKPWESKFTLKASDVATELGWDKRTDINKFDKLNEVAKASFALGCLLIQAVWVEGNGKKQVQCSVETSRMWDTAIKVRGKRILSVDKISEPDEVYITIRPGLWTDAFLNRAGCQAKKALYQFGYLAQDILKIDPYHDEMALRLALHLTIESRFHTSGTYKVGTLLKELLPKPIISEAREKRDKAYKLTKRWNHALEVLMGLENAFQIEFDPETYPEVLQPGSQSRKPRGYFEKFLAAKITIHPPAPIPELLASKTKPKLSKPKLNPVSQTVSVSTANYTNLSGSQIRNARKAKGWSQAKLAGLLGVSQRYISMFERGERIPNAKQESKIRKFLDLQ